MFSKLKPILFTAVVVLVVMAVIGRVQALEKIVFPNG